MLLEASLARWLPWHRSRLGCLARFLMALLAVRTVNLAEVALAFASPAKLSSRYKRLQRFVAQAPWSAEEGACLLARLCGLPTPWVLSLDRTEWALGWTKPVNFLVLGIVGHGVAFPVCWSLLGKEGCSGEPERRALLERFLALFGRQAARFVCMDREFSGKAWLQWLDEQGVSYRLRLKANASVGDARGRPTPVKRLLAHLRIGQAETLAGARRLWGRQREGLRVGVTALRLAAAGARSGDAWLIVVYPASELTLGRQALEDYRRRWGLECLFGALKSRGFRLEESRLHQAEPLERLFGVLALLFTWAHVVGQWVSRWQPPRRIAGRENRPVRSLFGLGLDSLRQLVVNPLQKARDDVFRLYLKLLSCA